MIEELNEHAVTPYRVVVVTAPAKLQALQPVCYNQAQVGQASAVLVFVAKKDNVAAGKKFIEERGLAEHAPDYAGMIEGMLGGIAATPGGGEAWSAKQAYIGLGFALAAAAETRTASCPMEGFDPAGVAAIIGANAEEEFVAVLLAVGRTHPDEKANSGGFPQWRWPKEAVIEMQEA